MFEKHGCSLVSQNSKPAGSCYLFTKNKCLEHLWIIWSPHCTQFPKTSSSTTFQHEIPVWISSQHPFLHWSWGKKRLPQLLHPWVQYQKFSLSGSKKTQFKKQQSAPFLSMNSISNGIINNGLKIILASWASACLTLASGIFFPGHPKGSIFENSKQHHFSEWNYTLNFILEFVFAFR